MNWFEQQMKPWDVFLLIDRSVGRTRFLENVSTGLHVWRVDGPFSMGCDPGGPVVLGFVLGRSTGADASAALKTVNDLAFGDDGR